MKNKWWIFFLLLFGCQSNKVEEKLDLPIPPPLPRHFLPPIAPPNFTPDIRDVYNIQINPVPHPFAISGRYAVFVNKQKIILNNHQINELISVLDLPKKKPEDTAELHSGNGWLTPFELE